MVIKHRILALSETGEITWCRARVLGTHGCNHFGHYDSKEEQELAFESFHARGNSIIGPSISLFNVVTTDQEFTHDEIDGNLSNVLDCDFTLQDEAIWPKRDATALPRLIFSDVDGTLIDGSLVLNHACWLHENGDIDLGNLPEKWKNDIKNETIMSELAQGYQKAITGLTEEELRVNDYLETVFAEVAFYDSISHLEEARDKGDEVVLVTGSSHFLAEPFAERMGFSVYSSKYLMKDGRLSGDVIPMFTAAAKREVVGSFDKNKYSVVVAYGDTASDLPLFEASDFGILVDPNSETRSTLAGKINAIVSKAVREFEDENV